MIRLAAVCVLLAFVGCKSEQAPTCAEVTDHVLSLVKAAYPGHGDMGGQGNRKAEIEQCELRKISPKERRCIMAATSADAVSLCRAKGPSQRTRAPTAPTP